MNSQWTLSFIGFKNSTSLAVQKKIRVKQNKTEQNHPDIEPKFQNNFFGI